MIYLVEDDESIRNMMMYTLEASGFEVKGFENGKSYFQAMLMNHPDLVMLDIMLPDMDGIEILKKMKKDPEMKDIPVIMVTAKGAEYDKVMGLDAGADDYVTKPFGMMELVSRIRAVLRRTSKKEEDDTYVLGEIRMDRKKHEVTVEGEPVALTLKEYELLRKLMENQNIVLTRDKLLEEIWGYDFDGETRTVDVHVRTLRQKLGQAGEYIETVRGVGYRIGEIDAK